MSNYLDDCLDDNPIEEDFQQTYQCEVCGNKTYNENRLCSEDCEKEYDESYDSD